MYKKKRTEPGFKIAWSKIKVFTVKLNKYFFKCVLFFWFFPPRIKANPPLLGVFEDVAELWTKAAICWSFSALDPRRRRRRRSHGHKSRGGRAQTPPNVNFVRLLLNCGRHWGHKIMPDVSWHIQTTSMHTDTHAKLTPRLWTTPGHVLSNGQKRFVFAQTHCFIQHMFHGPHRKRVCHIWNTNGDKGSGWSMRRVRREEQSGTGTTHGHGVSGPGSQSLTVML